MELKRNGYGSNFNKLYIDTSSNIIQKECYHSYGMKKITNEIAFLHFINNNNIPFPIPKVYTILTNGYTMEYMNNYIPLYQTYDIQKTPNILKDIMNKLTILHSFDQKITTREIYLEQLLMETNTKIYDRYELIKSTIFKYNFIKSVNGISIYDFDYIMDNINHKIIDLVKQKDEYYFVPIHGDCQFNNILINPNTNDICFIDPRGYFGNMEIYGIKEYDFAKVLFALSGYDSFDNSDITCLNINNDNIEIQTNILDVTIFDNCHLETLIMLSIWLGNAHCFIHNENKLMYSYFIAMYYSTLILRH